MKVAPDTKGGAEISLFNLLSWLRSRGHDVHALTSHKSPEGQFNGIPIERVARKAQIRSGFKWSDIAIAQLGWSSSCAKFAMRYGRPWVHMIRDQGELPPHGRPHLTIFNSDTGRNESEWDGNTAVLHPQITPYPPLETKGKAILQINLSEFKGSHIFFELARRMPDRSFIGQKGGWGKQVIPDNLPSNVTIVEPTDNILNTYKLARLILMPSERESFGRVALEAAHLGIPVIGTPVKGLQEVLGRNGLFATRQSIDAWTKAIELLDNDREYRAASRNMLQRAASFDSESELMNIEQKLLEIAR